MENLPSMWMLKFHQFRNIIQHDEGIHDLFNSEFNAAVRPRGKEVDIYPPNTYDKYPISAVIHWRDLYAYMIQWDALSTVSIIAKD